MDQARLHVSNLCKSFSTPVLKNVNLSIAAGEVHGIVGENGAGKTTLVNILAGLVRKDSGNLFLDRIAFEPSTPKDGFNAGISCATQELSIIETLSVAENIGLWSLPCKNFVIQKRALNRQVDELLKVVGLDNIVPDTLAEHLSLAERQLLELAKALASDCRLLILDEPTAALAGPQSARLHEIITKLAKSGTSVIYISHRLDDVLAVSDTISILRDGQVALSAPTNTVSVQEVIKQMSGHNSSAADNVPPSVGKNSTVLKAENVTTKELPHALSFTCHSGEIVGIAGLAGSGKSELLNALFGLAGVITGRISRCTETGQTNVDKPSRAVKSGIGYLGEERFSMGIFPGQSVVTNMMLPGGSQATRLFTRLDRAAELTACSELIHKLSIRCEGSEQPIEQLSGGNQQKVLIARWLYCDSQILLLDEPTRGVDVSTKSAIYDLLFKLRSDHKTVVIASSDIEELMTVCSRILVLSDRKLVREFAHDEFSETDILAAAFQEFTGSPLIRMPVGSDRHH